jgi:hypothetical protein
LAVSLPGISINAFKMSIKTSRSTRHHLYLLQARSVQLHQSFVMLVAHAATLEFRFKFWQLLWRDFFYTVAFGTPNFDRMEGNKLCKQVSTSHHICLWISLLLVFFFLVLFIAI